MYRIIQANLGPASHPRLTMKQPIHANRRPDPQGGLNDWTCVGNSDNMRYYLIWDDFACSPADFINSRIAYLVDLAEGETTTGGIADELGPDLVSKSRFGTLSILEGDINVWDILDNDTKADCASLATLMKVLMDLLGVTGAEVRFVFPRHASWSGLWKLAAEPDAEPKKLQFYMRGLGRPFDPPEAKVLRQILMLTHNDELRAAAIRQLSKWIVDDADSRQTIVADLAARLQDPNQQVRQDALRAIGQGGDIRQLEKVMPLLDDANPQVRGTALKAMADLLGWKLRKTTDAATMQQQLEQAKLAGESVVRSLTEAERLAGGEKQQ